MNQPLQPTQPTVAYAFASEVIEDALVAFTDAAIIPQVAELILARLAAAQVVVLNPQDVMWGSCPDNVDFDAPDGNGPHVVSLDLCAYCLEYSPS